MNTCLCYSRCTTCKKAIKWLDDHHVEYQVRPIADQKPSADELKAWSSLSGKDLRKFFNTSGKLYREMGLSKKVGTMTPDEMLSILSTDGMLVKRPIFVTDSTVLVGFKEAEDRQAAAERAGQDFIQPAPERGGPQVCLTHHDEMAGAEEARLRRHGADCPAPPVRTARARAARPGIQEKGSPDAPYCVRLPSSFPTWPRR